MAQQMYPSCIIYQGPCSNFFSQHILAFTGVLILSVLCNSPALGISLLESLYHSPFAYFDLNVKCLTWTHMFKHLVPKWWRYFTRSWNPEETEEIGLLSRSWSFLVQFPSYLFSAFTSTKTWEDEAREEHTLATMEILGAMPSPTGTDWVLSN